MTDLRAEDVDSLAAFVNARIPLPMDTVTDVIDRLKDASVNDGLDSVVNDMCRDAVTEIARLRTEVSLLRRDLHCVDTLKQSLREKNDD